jgi:hypothetical protein
MEYCKILPTTLYFPYTIMKEVFKVLQSQTKKLARQGIFANAANHPIKSAKLYSNGVTKKINLSFSRSHR